MKDNIVLIGMPGAGKSTAGVLLAKSLGYGFVDTDLLLQNKYNDLLQNIINTKGIEKFLSFEEKLIASLCCKSTVIATGGSVVYSELAMQHLCQIGMIVYIDVPLTCLKKRLNNISTRGIVLPDGYTIDDLYNERLPLYKRYGEITVNSGKNSVEELIEKIISMLKEQ